jgi:hypothetical protein
MATDLPVDIELKAVVCGTVDVTDTQELVLGIHIYVSPVTL